MVPQRPLGHPAFVLVVEAEVVEVGRLHIRQRDVGPLGGRPELGEVVRDGADVDALCIPVPSEGPDGVPVTFLDIDFSRTVGLPLEFGPNALNIGYICDSPVTGQRRDCDVIYYRSGGTVPPRALRLQSRVTRCPPVHLA